MKTRKKGSKLFAVLMSIMLIVTMMPAMAFATEGVTDETAPAVQPVEQISQDAAAPQFIVRAVVDGEVSSAHGLKTSFWMNTDNRRNDGKPPHWDKSF